MTPWLARYINPVVQAIDTGSIDGLTRKERSELMTPLHSACVSKAKSMVIYHRCFALMIRAVKGRAPTMEQIFSVLTVDRFHLALEAAFATCHLSSRSLTRSPTVRSSPTVVALKPVLFSKLTVFRNQLPSNLCSVAALVNPLLATRSDLVRGQCLDGRVIRSAGRGGD